MKENIKIETDEENEILTVNGKKISAIPLESSCSCCGKSIFYNVDYDANFCAYCNKWLEKKCENADCGFCGKRPAEPLDAISLENKRYMLKDMKVIEVE
ncbi:MAG: hypothetical protein OEZ13_04325 [Spirochaetia bacterium]|nr:hypothetical protein [Spirochaetia bacterium]